MTTPNIVNVTSILGYTNLGIITTTATDLITNSVTNSVYKLDCLMVANADSVGHTVTVSIVRSSVTYPVMYNVAIPPASSLDILAKFLYLQESDILRITSDTATTNKVYAAASYEVIT
jgi:hypothetical protein